MRFFEKAFFFPWLCLAALQQGCGDKDDQPGDGLYDGPRNTCNKNADCAEGSLCDRAISMCVRSDDLSGRRYLVRVKPAGLEAEVFEVVADGQPHFLTLKRYESVVVETYTVRSSELQDGGVLDEDVPVRLNGRLIARDGELSIPGRSSYSIAKPLSGSETRLALRPGDERYHLQITPSGDESASYPIQYLDDVTIVEGPMDTEPATDSEAETGQRLPFRVYSGTVVLAGKIKRGSQLVDGLTVEAIDPITSRTISTVEKTRCIDNTEAGAVCGEFNLSLIRDDVPFHLKVYRVNETQYPTTIISDFDVPVSGGRMVFSLDPLPAPIYYGASVRKPFAFETDNEVKYDGISGCTVIFESTSEGIGGGEVVVTAVTDEKGVVISQNAGADGPTNWIDIYPGSYRITVVPPDAAPGALVDFSIHEQERSIGTAGGWMFKDQELASLSFRALLRVRVTTDGEPIPGAVVTSEPLHGDYPHARRSRSFIGDDGRHSLWLDPGRHMLIAEVPAASGYAFGFQTVEIPADPKLAKRPVRLDTQDITAAVPNYEELYIRSTDTEVDVAGAKVEWFEVIEQLERAVLVARATVDKKGKARVFLPSKTSIEE